MSSSNSTAPANASCVFCRAAFPATGSGVEVSPHVCPKCGAPQPVVPGLSYFSLLGVPRGFKQDPEALEKKFYAISRELHPDRFAASGDPKWKVISVERMSAVNRAYQTLTKADRLRQYILELEGVVSGEAKAAVPADLAEEWFELQDAVMETPSEAEKKLRAFEADLKKRISEIGGRVSQLETEYDGASSVEARRESLKKIDKLSLDGQYLKSMERDLLKLKIRLSL